MERNRARMIGSRHIAAPVAAAVVMMTVMLAGACTLPPPPPDPPPPTYPGLPAGGHFLNFTFGGQERSYYLYVPTAVAGDPYDPAPLVVGLHGGGGSAGQMAATTELKMVADRDGFVVVLPEGVLLPRPSGFRVRTWDAGNCCLPAMGSGVDDVGFVAALIADIETDTAIDRSKVVAAGHSNGAMLAWRIACERADAISGAVVVEGSLERPSCAPSRGVTLVQVHGDSDTFVPLEGGNGPDSLTDTEFRSVAASQAMWTGAVACTGTTPSTGDHLAITLRTGCANGTTTKLVVIAGGTHAWAGADPASSADFLGEPSPYFSASEAIADLVASL